MDKAHLTGKTVEAVDDNGINLSRSG